MRSTIIPAQITTVEDKIAGNLNLTQIILLISPVIWTTFIYAILSPQMQLAAYKYPLIILAIFLCVALAIRIKGKVVIEWLAVLARYRLRPKYYVFRKSDLFNREVDITSVTMTAAIKLSKSKLARKDKPTEILVSDLVKLQDLVDSGKVVVSYEFNKKRI